MDLSIIIISFNTKKLTTECIESIVKNTKNIDFEIIVIDNNSSDGSVQAVNSLKNRKIKLELIRNRKIEDLVKLITKE
jgi:glycosyltransferase involved in cell wall biosynthesis